MSDTPQTATVEVPAEHQSLIERAVALLKKGEQTVVDNFEAGVAMLEGLFNGQDEQDQTADATPSEKADASTDTPAA